MGKRSNFARRPMDDYPTIDPNAIPPLVPFAVGRLKWIPDSKFTGKDNCAWYRFDRRHSGGPRFYGHQVREAA